MTTHRTKLVRNVGRRRNHFRIYESELGSFGVEELEDWERQGLAFLPQLCVGEECGKFFFSPLAEVQQRSAAPPAGQTKLSQQETSMKHCSGCAVHRWYKRVLFD